MTRGPRQCDETHAGSRRRPRGVTALVAAVWLAAMTPQLSANTWEGIDIVIDSDWPGCGHGGYFPIRISVVNRGQPRVMQFSFTSSYGNMPSVSKTVSVQTERLTFSLLVPCVGAESYGSVQVRVDGRYVPELLHSVSLPAVRSSDEQGPAVLLIDMKDTDWSNFKSALETLLGVPSAAGTPGAPYSGYTPTITVGDDHKYIPTDVLPGEWQAYTGLDLVAASAAQFERVSAEDREAILRWVDAGGSLLIFEAGGEDAAAQVERLLGREPPAGAAWDALGSGRGSFQYRDQMLGRIVAVKSDPFREFSPSQWQTLLGGIGHDRWEWFQRLGFSARHPSPNFMDFLIPSIKGVPVFAFLVLITLFAVVIGPVNYFYLWKQRRLYLLIVTIPTIALVTSLSLFGYSVIAHGFGTRARVRSLTFVDQPSNTAVCATRVSLYSGLAPSAGLQFSRDSAIFPLWAPDVGFESGSVDWTEGQHFESGWLRSRTRTQFCVATHRNERGRLEVSPEAETLSVSNGFEWELEHLLVSDAEGRLYYGAGIAAGAGARLEPLTPEQLTAVRQRLQQDPLVAPAYAPSVSTSPGYSRYGGYYGYGAPSTSYGTNQAERLIQSLAQPTPSEAVLPRGRHYAAILAENPGVDWGVRSASEEASLHVLRGNY